MFLVFFVSQCFVFCHLFKFYHVLFPLAFLALLGLSKYLALLTFVFLVSIVFPNVCAIFGNAIVFLMEF